MQLSVDVDTYATSVRITVGNDGKLTHGHDLKSFMRHFTITEYVQRWRRYVDVYRFSAYRHGQLMIPRYCFPWLEKEVAPVSVVSTQIQPITPRRIHLALNPDWESRETQLKLIAFMANPTRFYKPVSAQTGIGKTHCAIATSCNLKMVTMIIVSGLTEQWSDAYTEQTNIKSKEIYLLQGMPSVARLGRKIRAGDRLPSVIIASTRTLYNYVTLKAHQLDGMISYPDFCTALGIGIKIVDEVHLNFHANTIIDLHSNILHNIYLSATYGRNQPQEKTLFDAVFPRELRYGTEFYKRYINITFASYDIGIKSEHTVAFVLAKGYNHAAYETLLLNNRERYFDYWVEKVLTPLVYGYYTVVRKPGQRLLILTTTKVFAFAVAQKLQEMYPNDTVRNFFSNDPNGHGAKENLSADIIVSTLKSSGAGRDIPGLKTCILTTSIGSEYAAEQCFGRVREIVGDEVNFVDMWNRAVYSHRNHYQTRSTMYKDKAKTYSELFL